MYLYTVQVDFRVEIYAPVRESVVVTRFLGEKLTYSVARARILSVKSVMEKSCPPWQSQTQHLKRQGVYTLDGGDRLIVLDSRVVWWRKHIQAATTLDELFESMNEELRRNVQDGAVAAPSS